MSRRTTLVAALAAAAVFAGCGGGRSVPPANRTADALQQSAAARAVSSLRSEGTLYYADTSNVYALPLNAKGASTATRTITPHPENQGINTAIATNLDATLDVQQNYFDGTGEHCRVTVEPADANGSPAASDVLCDPTTPGTQGDGVGRNAFGGFDMLYNTPNTFFVSRWANDGASNKNTLTLGPPGYAGLYLATHGGRDYLVNSGGEVRIYRRGATTVDSEVADCTVSAYYGDGPLAVANATNIYLVVRGDQTLGNESIEVISACGTGGAPATVARTIGPFPNAYISTMAVDNGGALYVALNSLDNASPAYIDVFNNTANGAPAPTRVIAPSPSTTYIRGLTTWEPTPAPTASPSPSPSPAPSPTP
jgi:hypothetical protein